MIQAEAEDVEPASTQGEGSSAAVTVVDVVETPEEIGKKHDLIRRLSSEVVDSIIQPSIEQSKDILGFAGKDDTDTQTGAEEVKPIPERLATQEEIKSGLSELGRSTSGGIAFATFTAENVGLTSVGFLERFPLLENVNLSKNQLANIEVIGALRSLFDLNVRENRLTVCPGFVEPLNLRVADFGENDIHTIEGFSEGTPLRQLNLDKNKLTKITGLSTCHLLTELSLADNQITSSDGLEGLTSLKVLELQRNRLTTLELSTLTALERLDISDNALQSLSGLGALRCLFSLSAARNKFKRFDELHFIFGIKSLVHVDFRENPINSVVDYRTGLIFRMKHVVTVDGKVVDPLDKVSAVNLFDPPPQTVAAVDHAMQASSIVKKLAAVHAFHLAAADDVYPILVLVGPATGGKRDLAHLLVKDNHEDFEICRSHTTRMNAVDADVGGSFAAYHHINFEQFQTMVEGGEFLQTCRINNEMYGLTRHELERVVESQRIPVLMMELEGAFILKKLSVGATYVYVRPNMSGLLGNSGSFSHFGELKVSPPRLAKYEATDAEGYFDHTVTLGRHDHMPQFEPIRRHLTNRLHKIRNLIPRHHPQWISAVAAE